MVFKQEHMYGCGCVWTSRPRPRPRTEGGGMSGAEGAVAEDGGEGGKGGSDLVVSRAPVKLISLLFTLSSNRANRRRRSHAHPRQLPRPLLLDRLAADFSFALFL